MKKNNISMIKATTCILAIMAGLASTASADLLITGTTTWTTADTGPHRILNIDGGTFIMQSGTLQVGDSFASTGGYLKVQNGGKLQIEGGTFNFDGRPVTDGGGTFQVIGNAATIAGYQLSNTMSYDFDFTAAGISKVTTASYVNMTASTLDVDVSAYDFSGLAPSASQSFTLFDASSVSSLFDLGNVNIAGLNPLEYSATLVQSLTADFPAETDISVVVTAVPEPATFALLGGLLALGCVMVRRRRA